MVLEKPSFLYGLEFKKQSKNGTRAVSISIFPAVMDIIGVFLCGFFQFIQFPPSFFCLSLSFCFSS